MIPMVLELGLGKGTRGRGEITAVVLWAQAGEGWRGRGGITAGGVGESYAEEKRKQRRKVKGNGATASEAAGFF